MSEDIKIPQLVQEGRRLVTVRKINDLLPIEGADRIELAKIDGWTTIVKKGEFSKDDFCIFFEVDSFLPIDDQRYEFLKNSKNIKTDSEGIERIRIKTMKMRGCLSQGLALPLKLYDNILNEIGLSLSELETERYGIEEWLNVTKYEANTERQTNGGGSCKQAGNFPWFIPKTEADRLQNRYNRYNETLKGVPFRPSLKMDGSSITVAYVSSENLFIDKMDDQVLEFNEETKELDVKEILPYPFKDENGMIIVCSRNFALKYDSTSSFWKGVHETQLHEKLRKFCVEYDRQLAVQGECIGTGMNGNREGLDYITIQAFHIFDIDKQEYVDDGEFQELCNAMDIVTVPQFPIKNVFDEYKTIGDFLKASDIPSINNPVAEGIVYKSTNKVQGQTIMFKVINNEYLLREK